MKETPNVGHTPPENAHRDAIHVAVAPVVAGHVLAPGDEVALENGEAVYSDAPIGIADPFSTKDAIEAGERFWLFLYPGTITSLRHVWTHPAFQPKPPGGGE